MLLQCNLLGEALTERICSKLTLYFADHVGEEKLTKLKLQYIGTVDSNVTEKNMFLNKGKVQDPYIWLRSCSGIPPSLALCITPPWV